MNVKQVYSLCFRYGLLIVLGLASLFLGEGVFYTIFTPLTIKPVYLALHAFYDAAFFPPNVIFFKGYYASLIPACIAGSAYYLLLILNLTTPMSRTKRLASITFLMLSFLILNIVRIVIMGALLFEGYRYFDITHLTSWYVGSTLLVVALWFAAVKWFSITDIPIVSDVRRLVRDIKKH